MRTHWYLVRRCYSVKSIYSSTVLVPKTKFPVKIGKKTNEHEIEIQNVCDFSGLYKWQHLNNTSDKQFILHDGPPYANGDVHVGHALNKILKDITNRYKLLRGYQVHYKPGWDCHGLPIEIKAIKANEFKTLNTSEIRKKSKSFAEETIEIQKRAFQRWGVMADWGNSCYYTYDKDYQAKELNSFYKLYERGFVYRALKPVYWSPSSGTALAESELVYNDNHISRSVYVTFPLLSKLPELSFDDVIKVLVWTTQPWTLPANQTLCFSPNIKYCIASCTHASGLYLLAVDCIEAITRRTGEKFNILQTFDGSCLEGMICRHPMYLERTVRMISSDIANTSKGTGVVHIAPAHGTDDFGIGQKHNLSTESSVNSDGEFMAGIAPNLEGKFIFTSGNEAVVEMLKEEMNLFHEHDYKHSYPYDWRTKQPIFVHTSNQWFVDTAMLANKAEAAISGITTYPDNGVSSMLNRLQLRSYWCISRQRAWGLPIPVFYHKESDELLLNESTIQHLVSLVLKHGADIWWEGSNSELLSPKYNADEYERGSDILDIWFDSGVSWDCVLRDNKNRTTQADFYIEGKDQYGGWFQSSLLTSVGLQGVAPYKNLMVHGFVLDEKGQKMSKSIGNVVDPMVLTNGGKNPQRDPAYGADALRWWVAESNVHQDIHISATIIKSAAESVQKIRNSVRFMLGNLNEFDETNIVQTPAMLILDQYFMDVLRTYKREVTAAYEVYDYSLVTRLTLKFIKKFSNIYFTIVKDRLYCDEKESLRKRSCQSVLYFTLDALLKSVAPILPHLVEETTLYNPTNNQSVFKSGWYTDDITDVNIDIINAVETALNIRDDFNLAIVGKQPTTYDVTLTTDDNIFKTLKRLTEGEGNETTLSEILTCAECTVVGGGDTPWVVDVKTTTMCKCPRCRRYKVTSSGQVCDRCMEAMTDGWNE
ncbi:isoleucine--tRNA ligase, mitochondrial isoform X1 [Ciona intestinalis]